MTSRDLGGFSMWELFRAEVESHSTTLNAGLLALEQHPGDLERIKALMRAAHSIKGAARVVRHDLAVEIAHAMEDRLVAAQQGQQPLTPEAMQLLLDGVDLLGRVSPTSESARDPSVEAARADAERVVRALRTAPQVPAAPPASSPPPSPGAPPAEAPVVAPPAATVTAPAHTERAIRLTAQGVTRMMGLAGEAVVGLRWLEPFGSRLASFKGRLADAARDIEGLAQELGTQAAADQARGRAFALYRRVEDLRADVTELIAGLEGFLSRQEALSDRLFREVQSTRMRPFADLAEAFPRLVRDLAKQLGKQVRLEVEGRPTEVDRDVAAMLEAPLIHAVRNAIDHGIELPADRLRAGKPETGTIRLSAWHRAGMLRVEVADDGRGVEEGGLRQVIVRRGLADEAMVARLSSEEVLAFLFLPGFTTAASVSDVSGRGVGLDVAMEAVKQVGGKVHVTSRPGAGLTLRFDVPVTLSVMAALITEVAGEPYALPMNRIERVERVARDVVRTLEGRAYVTMTLLGGDHADGTAVQPSGSGLRDEQLVGLVTARQVLGVPGDPPPGDTLSVVVIRNGRDLYGLVVDRIVGEQSIAVRPLDARLGKVPNIGAAGLMVDAEPLLVVDVDDLVRRIDQILTGGRLAPIAPGSASGPATGTRVLIVDDSITVREVERQLLESQGYRVEVAVDGIDGWNAVRTGHYDLVVTDVDMPRMDGFELVRRIRADRRFATLPVMVVSYKDRDEDRLRGLDAGASYYLPKASFQDQSFLAAVVDLIGHPTES